MDVASVRAAILFFAGQHPDVRKVLDVARAGKVSNMAASATGGSARAMVEKENIEARGVVSEGRIVLPKSGLTVEGIEGEAGISHGFLEGTNLSGRMGANRATKGRFWLAMKKGTPFRLDMYVKADLAELPFYLRRIVRDPDFGREMGMVRSSGGKAEGRVVFDSLQLPTRTTVDVSSFTLHASYSRFPHPFDIEGRTFRYDRAGGKVRVQGLSGKAGSSSFSGLSGELGLKGEHYLSVDSAKALVRLGEIYPWLRSIGKIGGHLEKIGPAQGSVRIGSTTMKGPILRPSQWRFRVTGEAENVVEHPAGLPGPVEARAGRFDATQERLSFSGLRARCLDASFVLSGDAGRYLEGLDNADLRFGGEMGERSARWLSDFLHLPRELRPRTPLSISNARLLWRKGGEASVSGDLAVRHGPRVSLALSSRPDELAVKPLVIRDAESNASLLFSRRGKTIDVAFRGNLTAGTANALLAEEGLLTGAIRGDIEAHIVPDEPFGSTARGTLEGSGITAPPVAGMPLKIASFNIRAEGRNAAVISNFTALGQTMSARGRIAVTRNAFVPDIELTTGGLDLTRITRTHGGKAGEALGRLPLEGCVRVRPEYVTYGKYLWKPVEADITFRRGAWPMAILVKKANVCGIDTPGRIEYDNGVWQSNSSWARRQSR